MNNQKLLKKYKIKLSLLFALFVMLSLYSIQTFFLGAQFITNNLNLKNHLENKFLGIVNVLTNKNFYYKQIESDDKTLQKVILKTLENSIIYKNGEKLIDFVNFETNIGDKTGIIDNDYKKYLVKNININNDDYKIIIYLNNNYSFNILIRELFFYSIVLTPFFILFYGIGYFFISRNFRVIEQSINSLEDFTANINHEIKTPLSEIISTLSLAKKIGNYEEASEISLNSAKKINKIIESMIGLVNLSDISYIKEKIDLIKELEIILKENKNSYNEKNILIIKNFKNKSFWIKINKEHFYLCVNNILSNAIKYSNIGGKIEIFFNNGTLEIKDYGIGIEKKNLKNIFNRYFRESYTNEQGFGLGLALVKKITDINKWRLDIESEKNTFTNISINFN